MVEYLEDYSCDWEKVKINNHVWYYPDEMFNRVLNQWEQYCPAECNQDLGLLLGGNVEIKQQTSADFIEVFLMLPHMMWSAIRFKNKEENLCN